MQTVLALLLSLLGIVHGRCPDELLDRTATAIARATSNRRERAVLASVAWVESRFGRDDDLVFGVIACRRRHCDVETEARIALRGIRSARWVCRSRSLSTRMSYYHHGRVGPAGCRVDRYGRLVERLALRLIRGY